MRQVETTSPHSGYFHAPDSSIFQSTRQFLGYVHPDPAIGRAVRMHAKHVQQQEKEAEAGIGTELDDVGQFEHSYI